MGDLQPEAQVNGFAGCNLTALIFNNFSATNLSSVFIQSYIYIYISLQK